MNASLFPSSPEEEKPPMFFMLRLDAVTTARVQRTFESLQQALGLQGDPTRPDKFHVTLGSPKPDKLRASLDAATLRAASRVRVPAFDAALTTAQAFQSGDGKHPFVLGVDEATARGIAALRAALVAQLTLEGVKLIDQGVPHMTLLRGPVRPPQQAIDPIAWRVSQFELVGSVPKQPYRSLGVWALG